MVGAFVIEAQAVASVEAARVSSYAARGSTAFCAKVLEGEAGY
jgi:hypothetical protein